MNIIDQHIRKHLLHFQDEEDASFQEIFELIQSEVKNDYNSLLRYIHFLLDEAFLDEKTDSKSLHLHFDYNFDDVSLFVISQYLVIRSFNENCKANISSSQDNEKLLQLKIGLQLRKDRLLTCPSGASGIKKNKEWKQWNLEKNKINSLIRFYGRLNDNVDISWKVLFNCPVGLFNTLNNLCISKPYACVINDNTNTLTFNLLNSTLTLNEIDEIDNSIIDNLDTIILFDCERKKIMQNFSFQDIKEYDICLKKYLIITFGSKKASIQNLRGKINLIQNRFKIYQSDSYPIIQSEIDYSLGQNSRKYIPVSFIGITTSNFWDAFVLETNIQDLYELRSIKMMNLYSLCFDHEIKHYIFQEIFSDKEASELISDETKQCLLYLRSEDLSTLKELLGNVLDLIISSDIKRIIINKVKCETVFIIDDFILKSKKLSSLIFSSLLLTRHKLISWSTFNATENDEIIVLSYRDQGKYPYHFYPNIIETTTSKSTIIEAFFHKFLFSNRYLWAKYNVSKEMCKLMEHPIRKKNFHWERLKESIKTLRPQKNDNVNWDLEQQYSGNYDRETIKLKLKNERERTFNSSELFIYSTNNLNFKIDKIGDIIEAIDDDVKCFVHNLDEIQESINLYEKIVDTKQQQEELNIIRQQFAVSNESTGRLWKILLNKEAQSLGESIVYGDLKKYLEAKGLKIVSLHHFKNNWLNPESDSIAPLNKNIFMELCSFLKLPKIYFILIHRIRNASKQSTRESTRQMNRLLQNLFNDGCFDDGAILSEIIPFNLENYKKKHPLDELGIDEKYLGDNLITLVELIKPEITLKEIENFKKAE